MNHAATVRSGWATYRALVGARFRAQWQYRTSFVVDAIGSFLLSFVEFVTILVLFRHIDAISGWSISEVMFLYGTAGMGFALSDMFIGHIEDVGQLIRLGTFDSFLLRPANSLLQVAANDIALRRVGKFLQAAIIFAIAAATASIDWTALRAIMSVAQVISAAMIFTALFVFWSCSQFWLIGIGEIANGFTYGGNYVSNYPFSILGPWLRRFLTYLIPLAFVSYFPSMYVLGRDDAPLGYQLVGPLVATASLAVAVATWQFAVRHYRSTGS